LWIADLPAMLAVAPKKNNDQFNINQISQQLQATFSQAKSRINAIKITHSGHVAKIRRASFNLEF